MFSGKGFLRALYPLLLLIVLVNRWKPFLVLTFPFFILAPAAIFIQNNFNAPMNESFWLIIFGSNVNEAVDFMSSLALIPTALGLCLIGLWIYFYKKNRPEALVKNRWIKMFLWSFLLIPMVHFYKGRADVAAEFNHHFTESFPMNVVLSYASATNDLNEFSKVVEFTNIDQLKDVSVSNGANTVVLIIGESARRDRLHLYGKTDEQNNPYLTNLKSELFLFTDLISLHPHTVASVPVMLTKQRGIEKPFELQYSFLEVFKAAGFKTYWISNQATLWGKGSIIGKLVKGAEFKHFFHIHDANNPTLHDDKVIDLFKVKLNEPNAPTKRLFVLHLQGSHYSFEKRYPDEFAKFKDPYDNSLLYTDFLISEVIASLKSSNLSSAMLYTSDHGLLLNACGKKYTHFDNKESFEIPFFAWANEGWRSTNPDKVSNLNINLNKSLTTEILFDSLIDFAGIKYPGYRSHLSVLSPDTTVGKRLVKTYSDIVDYDSGKNNNDCHLSNE